MSSRLVVAVLACLAVTACSAGLSKTVTNNPIPVPSQTQLTGTTLDSLLLPLSAFPAGAEVDTQDSGDSGAALLAVAQQPAAPRDCQHLGQSLAAVPGGLTAAASQVLYDSAFDDPSSDRQRRYDQHVYQFATATESAAYFDLVRSAFTRCPTVATKTGTATVVIKRTISQVSPVDGQRALLTRQAGTVKGVTNGSVALLALDGRDVYEVSETVSGVPLVSQPSSLALQVAQLITSVQTYACALACPAPDGS
jgi:hypothetical protein